MVTRKLVLGDVDHRLLMYLLSFVDSTVTLLRGVRHGKRGRDNPGNQILSRHAPGIQAS